MAALGYYLDMFFIIISVIFNKDVTGAVVKYLNLCP
jgi:hypothetical protein